MERMIDPLTDKTPYFIKGPAKPPESAEALDLKRDWLKYPSSIHTDGVLRMARGQEITGLAREVSDERRRQMFHGEQVHGNSDPSDPLPVFYNDLIRRTFPNNALILTLADIQAYEHYRALSAGTATAGGLLIGTDHLDPQQALLPYSAVFGFGAQIIPGLRGTTVIDRELTRTTFGYYHEQGTITTSSGTFGQARLMPHRLGGAAEITQQWHTQTGGRGMDFWLRSLKAGLGQGVDDGALTGSGVDGEVLGMFNAEGTNSITFGGAATWIKLLDAIEKCATANANDAALAWITHPRVRERWMNIQRFSGSSNALWDDNDRVAGKRAAVSTACAATDCIVGDWGQVVIGFFGPPTIPFAVTVDPYSLDLEGKIRVVIETLVDCAVLRADNFTKNADTAVA